MLYLMYAFGIKKTFAAYTDCMTAESQIELAANAPVQAAQLEKQVGHTLTVKQRQVCGGGSVRPWASMQHHLRGPIRDLQGTEVHATARGCLDVGQVQGAQGCVGAVVKAAPSPPPTNPNPNAVAH